MAAVATAQALNCPAPVSRMPGPSPSISLSSTPAARALVSRASHGASIPTSCFSSPNDKGNIKIDPVREAIDRAGYRPFEGRRRVTIINQADVILETSAQNALLEGPRGTPASSVFILVTALPDTLLPTVRSRCPQLRFRALEPDDVVSALQKRGFDERKARQAALLADGSIGAALAADEVDVDEVDAREVALRVLALAAASEDGRRRIEIAKDLVVKGASASSVERDQLAVYLRAMSSLLRDIEAIASSTDDSILANADLLPKLQRLSAFAGERGRKAFQAVDGALAALDRYTNAKLVADWLVLQL